MKLYFRDIYKQLRGVKVDWQLETINDQASLKAVIKHASHITPIGPILGIVGD